MVFKNIALKAYNRGFTHAQERINAKIEGLADCRERPTYASKVGKKVPSVTGSTIKIRSVPQVLVISLPTGTKIEQHTSNKVKDEVMRLIDPVKEKIGIRGLKKRDNGKVCIEMTSVEDVKKIMENAGLKQAGIQVAKSGLLNPRLIVFDVPKDLDTPRFIKVAYSQNESLLAGVDEEEFRNGFLPKFRTGKRDGDLVNWVVEASPKPGML